MGQYLCKISRKHKPQTRLPSQITRRWPKKIRSLLCLRLAHLHGLLGWEHVHVIVNFYYNWLRLVELLFYLLLERSNSAVLVLGQLSTVRKWLGAASPASLHLELGFRILEHLLGDLKVQALVLAGLSAEKFGGIAS